METMQTPCGYRRRLSALALMMGALFAATLPARVAAQLPSHLVQIPQSGMTASASGYQAWNSAPSYAINGNTANYWEVRTAGEQWIQIDLGQSYGVCAITVYAGDKRIYGYKLYLADEPAPADWGSPVAEGEFQDTSVYHPVVLNPSHAGRFVRLVATSRWSDYVRIYNLRVYTSTFILADRQTGRIGFTNSNVVDVVAFPAYPDYDQYQITDSDIEPVGGWLAYDPETPPATDTFTKPGGNAEITRYAWFSHSTGTPAPVSIPYRIIYTAEPPVVNHHATLSLDTYDGQPLVLGAAQVNDGSTGGTIKLDETDYDLRIHSIGIALAGGEPAASIALMPGETYTVTFTVTNHAGSIASDTCEVTINDVVKNETTANVTWSGGAVPLNPEWFRGQNWAGGRPPANPTPATVTFDSAGQAVTSLLETDRQMHRLNLKESGEATAHTLDLGGHTLTVSNQLFFTISGGGNNRQLTFRNGTLRMGTETTAATMDIDRSDVVFGTGGKLHTLNLDTISLPTALSRNALLDLRGAEVVGGTLEARVISLYPGRGYGSRILLNGATAIDTIRVRASLSVGDGMSGSNNPLYIGNPSDLVTLDDRNIGRLPAGIDLLLGVSEAQRATVTIGNISYADNAKGYGAIRVAPGGGGSFTGYIGNLRIGTATSTRAGHSVKPRGVLHLAEMDSCMLDVRTLSIATARTAAELADDHWGELWLPTGIATVGTATIGADAPLGRGFLSLSNTAFTVTNALTLNATGEIVINMGDTPIGLDIEQGFTDAGGRIHVNFLAAPATEGATNWAVRVAGDAFTTLSGMVGGGGGRLTSSGTFAGWKTGVLRDETYAYFAMIDENLAFPPVAVAKDASFHIEPGGTVLVDISEIDNGSNDPAGRTPVAITMSKNGPGGPFDTNLSFNAVGEYEVTLKIEVGDPAEDFATDTATLTITDLAASSGADLTWAGGAGTVLMDRREWFWPNNWAGGHPPQNPTDATITFSSAGQDVTGVLDADRRIGHLNVSQGAMPVAHTINLGGYALTASNGLSFTTGGGESQLTLTNGMLNLGDDDGALTLIIDRSDLIIGAGGKLDARGVDSIQLPTGLSRNALLDLQGAEVVGGAIDVRELSMTAARGYGGRIFLNNATSLDRLAIRQTFVMGQGWANGNGPQYIGNPSDPFSLDGRSLGRFPAGIDLRFGVDAAQRANVTIVDMNVAQNNPLWAAIRVAPGGGGAFTGYVGTLNIAIGTASDTAASIKPRGMLHLAEMDSCVLDIQTLRIATARAAVNAEDDHQGELWLPPGTALVGSAEIGANAALGHGLLSLSNTTFTVTDSLKLHKTADVRIQVGATAGGLELANAAPGALVLDPEAAIAVSFHATPSHAGLHYGLRLAGDHVTPLTDLQTAGRLTIDSVGLVNPAEIFRLHGATYIGIPPPGGSLFLLR